MHSIKSKYKNPDRLIERLKETIKSDNSRLEYHFKKIGELQNQIAELKKSILGDLWFYDAKDVTSVISTKEIQLLKEILGKKFSLKEELVKFNYPKNQARTKQPLH